MNRLEDHREVMDLGFSPRWSPDGRWIAFTSSDPEGGAGNLWVVSTSLTSKTQLTRNPEQMYGLTWTADSQSIIFASRRDGVFHLWQLSLADRSLSPLTVGLGSYVSPSVTADSETVVFCYLKPVRDLVLVENLASEERKQLTYDQCHLRPRLSPSGSFVASVVRGLDLDEHLFVTEIHSGKGTPLTNQPVKYHCWVDEENVAYLQKSPSRIEHRCTS